MAKALGTMTVGDSVKLKVNGTPTEFVVVNHGKPSDIYDESCDGTWLLMKDCYENRQWHNQNVNDYENSDIHNFLNGAFLNVFEENIKNAIKEVRIPYRPNSGTSATIKSGADGLPCRVFLLSGYEVGWTTKTNQYFPMDGAVLEYFKGTKETDEKRIAKLKGSAVGWWLRSPSRNYSDGAWGVRTSGSYYYDLCSDSYGVRPALILSSSLLVSEDGGEVTTNTAPTAPPSITIPESISGGQTITVSWEKSSDAEENLEGYVVERNVNGGDAWDRIYQGDALKTTNTVVFGTKTVMYRVKAYDAEKLESTWTNSKQVTVINNVSPSAPPTISVPNDVKGGGTVVVSWTASTDADDNLSGYELERCVNGTETWNRIYQGDSLSHTDSIEKGLTKVRYRVRAYDKLNAFSGYTTSPERTVDNNVAPSITCSYEDKADLGEKSVGFTVDYSVDDVDEADTLTVTEALDGQQKRQYQAERRQTNHFEVTDVYFQKILNGKHTLTITVSDGKASATRTLTFTKSVHTAKITLSKPMEADDKITLCAITVAGDIPPDASFKVEVTNNAKDDAPEWEDATDAARTGRNHVFKNQTASKGFAFNFRVTATRGDSGAAGNITSIQGGFQ